MQGAWVQSLLGELRSHMLCSAAKKKTKTKKTELNLEPKPTNFFCEEPESKYIQDLKPWFLLQLLSSTIPGKPENISK